VQNLTSDALTQGFSTQRCANWLATASYTHEPKAWEEAARTLADTLAAAFVGCSMEATLKLKAAVSTYSGGDCSLMGANERLAGPWAALVNGTAAHVGELDDNFMAAGTHGSAVLWPALLACAQTHSSKGGALLDAYVAGMQIQWRLSQVMNPSHGKMGWHPTSTIAAISAAGACAFLMGLTETQIAHALNLSASMASGGDAQFGSNTKALHAGFAAKAGYLAAEFARAGMTAGHGALEQMIGLMGGDAKSGPSFTDFGQPCALTTSGVTMKIWPTCGSTHPAIQAALNLRDQLGPRALDQVMDLQVFIPAILNANLKYKVPEDENQARFSLEFAVASAWLDGRVDLPALHNKAWLRDDIRALMARIVRNVIPDNYADLRITIKANGQSASASLDELIGSLKRPLSTDQLVERLMSMSAGRLDSAHSRALWDAITKLGNNGSVSDVMVRATLGE
jgi:2-methylcitrate dehydratase PrpD